MRFNIKEWQNKHLLKESKKNGLDESLNEISKIDKIINAAKYDPATAKKNFKATLYYREESDGLLKKYMKFLNQLRDTGLGDGSRVDMRKAAKYLDASFWISMKEAKVLLAYWMGTNRKK